jgi:hypothetical protein
MLEIHGEREGLPSRSPSIVMLDGRLKGNRMDAELDRLLALWAKTDQHKRHPAGTYHPLPCHLIDNTALRSELCGKNRPTVSL